MVLTTFSEQELQEEGEEGVLLQERKMVVLGHGCGDEMIASFCTNGMEIFQRISMWLVWIDKHLSKERGIAQ